MNTNLAYVISSYRSLFIITQLTVINPAQSYLLNHSILSWQSHAGLQKNTVRYLGQVNFLARQVTFHSQLPTRQRPSEVVYQLNYKLRQIQHKQNLRAA